jgi:inositol phosphorylceramide mannosyltransferase catalytic subunit
MEHRARTTSMGAWKWDFDVSSEEASVCTDMPDADGDAPVTPGALFTPRLVHIIWIGPTPMPTAYHHYHESWAAYHPGWSVKLWTDEDLPSLLPRMRNADLYQQLHDPRAKADVLRYEILYLFGGVYVDADMECLRSIEPLLVGLPHGTAFFAAREDGVQVNNAVLGARVGSPVLAFLLRNQVRWVEYVGQRGYRNVWDSTGPNYLTAALGAYMKSDGGRTHIHVAIFEPSLFYPTHFSTPMEMSRAATRHAIEMGHVYAVHHWGSVTNTERGKGRSDGALKVLVDEAKVLLGTADSVVGGAPTDNRLSDEGVFLTVELLSVRVCGASVPSQWRICAVLEKPIEGAVVADVPIACYYHEGATRGVGSNQSSGNIECETIRWRLGPAGKVSGPVAHGSKGARGSGDGEDPGVDRGLQLRVDLLDSVWVYMAESAYAPSPAGWAWGVR